MKKIVLVALVLLSTNFSFAQFQFEKKDPSGIGLFSNSSSKDSYDPRSVNNGNSPSAEHEVRHGPLAPATLLLLGLGGCAVGATVYRNTRKEK